MFGKKKNGKKPVILLVNCSYKLRYFEDSSHVIYEDMATGKLIRFNTNDATYETI